MTASRETTPQSLFVRMMGGIALTSLGPVLLVLVLIVHAQVSGHSLAATPHDVLRVRMIALCAIVCGLPVWFFTQLRLARGIRDGLWGDSELAWIQRLVCAPAIRFTGLLTLLAYAVGICLRGRFYWLVGFGVLVFPLGAFGDLYKQFIVRHARCEVGDADSLPAAALPRATIH